MEAQFEGQKLSQRRTHLGVLVVLLGLRSSINAGQTSHGIMDPPTRGPPPQ